MRVLVGCFTAQRFGHRRKLCRATWWPDAERHGEVDRFFVAGAAGTVTNPWGRRWLRMACRTRGTCDSGCRPRGHKTVGSPHAIMIL